MLCTRPLFGFPPAGVILVALMFTAFLSLAACGGGDSADGPPATPVPTDVPATPIPPTTDLPAPNTVSPMATVPPAATQSPESDVSTPEAPTESPVAAPTDPPVAAPTVAAQVAPTEAPASFFLPRAVRNLGFSCSEQFRQALLEYDGVEEFGAEVARRLSDEFLEIRPDCLAEGWDPDISVGDQVCSDISTLPQA